MAKPPFRIDPPKRYIVTRPVPGGYSYWRVADTLDPAMPNAEVAIVRRDVPGARKLVYDLCRRLNEAKPARCLGDVW